VRVVFITLYNESARGTRWVAAAVQAAGHRVALVHFKRFRSRTIARHDAGHLAWAIGQAPYQVREFTAQGDRFHPYPAPVTDREIRLLIDLLERLKPDVIGFSFSTHALPLAVRLTGLVRESLPGIPVAWGGIHPIIDPEGSVAHADVVCPGEGEEAFCEYLADASRTDVAGLWFRTANGPIRNPLRRLRQDLDSLAWPLYGGDEYEIDEDRLDRQMAENPALIACMFYTETTRGCPFSCAYCIHSIARARYAGQRYIRNRSLENVMAEIQAFRRRFGGLQAILPFFDEILLMNKKRFARFAELYRREIGHPFCGFAHHQTTDREMLAIARTAGIAETSIGLQTGSVRIAREIYRRPIDPEAMIRLAREIHETGAGRLIVNVLCDCAFEREEDLRATFELLRAIPRPYLLQLSRVVPFPGTALAQMHAEGDSLAAPIREFWHLLYVLTQNNEIDSATLSALSADPFLRDRPEILDRLVYALHEPGGGIAEAASAPGGGAVRAPALARALGSVRRRLGGRVRK